MSSAESVVPITNVTDASAANDANPTSSTEKSDQTSPRSQRAGKRLERPKLGSRKSSGSIIIPRDSPNVEVKDEKYDDNDARAMSPRRSSDELQAMGKDARSALEEEAKSLQDNIQEMLQRVASVKSEHQKLQSQNVFLQSYIGELMQSSKMTSAAAPKGKGKGRNVK
ncbi:MAG: hypothetical protein M1831_001798 [Alyxoria varia]|nr:MAG: hypothetical protein M1831_001798 [Alyxoria varia]